LVHQMANFELITELPDGSTSSHTGKQLLKDNIQASSWQAPKIPMDWGENPRDWAEDSRDLRQDTIDLAQDPAGLRQDTTVLFFFTQDPIGPTQDKTEPKQDPNSTTRNKVFPMLAKPKLSQILQEKDSILVYHSTWESIKATQDTITKGHRAILQHNHIPSNKDEYMSRMTQNVSL
jgi:hypothetical protein